MDNCQVEQCLNELISQDLKLKSTIKEVKSITDYATSDSYQILAEQELVARECILHIKSLLSDLEFKANNTIDNPMQRVTFLKNVENYSSQLHTSQVELRKAVYAAKKCMDKQCRKELFDTSHLINSTSTTARYRGDTNQSASSNIALATSTTNEMHLLSQMISNQMNFSKDTLNVLIGSSQTIGETQREFGSMKDHIKTGGNLLTKLGRRRFTDKLLIWICVLFFVFTVFYILKRRVF